MGFFGQFFSWLNAQLASYIGTKTALVAAAIEPAAVTLGTIYVMIWGYLSLTGKIEEPLLEGFKRIVMMALILGVGIRLWLYNTVVANTFYNAPDQLAAAIVGAPTTVAVIDQVWIDGNLVAEQLLRKGSVLSGDFAYYLAGFFVYLLVGLSIVYTAFLLALSKVAVAVILAVGPLFIVLLFFDATKRFFEAWIAQLANYALITVLALMVSALMLSIIKAYASDAAGHSSGITIAESVRLCIAAVMVFLVMRQVMPIAAGLASGIALSSFGAVSALMNWGLGSAKRTGYDCGRGLLDGWGGESVSRWDSLRRGAGNRVGSGLAGLRDRVAGPRTGGTLIPRERVMPRSTTSRR
jgi:type IV secretion system protein VirB6